MEKGWERQKRIGFATRYTEAWSSQNAESVANCYAPEGSLSINAGSPAVGKAAITATAQSFMTAFPNLRVTMDHIDLEMERPVYHWTLTGTNTGPGGTGRAVRISGHEVWRFGIDGLIAESQGQFDEKEYQKQLTGPVSESNELPIDFC